MSILVFFLFFAILFVIIYGDEKKKFFALFAGTILFPNVCLFIQNPSISPQHLILYCYLLVEYFQEKADFKESIFKNPLIIPLTFISGSYICTALFNGGLLSVDMYYGVRDIIDTYGYLLAAYIFGKKFSKDDFAQQMFVFFCICCIFGIIEGLLNANYPYKIINSAFPKYNGLYDLQGSISLSQNWRIRTCFTTKHPTAFGTLLMSLFLFYLPYIKTDVIPKAKLLLILSLLGVNVILCGSRTALFCVIVGVLLYIIDKFNIILKIFVWGTLVFSLPVILAFMISQFQSTGSGSSIEFRTQQLIFSVMAIQESPVFGNGNKYASHNLFEEDEKKGSMRAHDESGQDMGGLESVVFTLLIDRGFTGLISYYLLLIWLLFIFHKNRFIENEKSHYNIILISGTFFLTLSGSIGNSSAFLYLLLGIHLGNIVQKKDELERIEDEESAGTAPSLADARE